MTLNKSIKRLKPTKKVIKKPAQSEFTVKAKDLAEIFENITIRRKRQPRKDGVRKTKKGTESTLGKGGAGPSFGGYLPAPGDGRITQVAPYSSYRYSYVPKIQDLTYQHQPQLTSAFTPSDEELRQGYKDFIGRTEKNKNLLPNTSSSSSIGQYDLPRLTVEEIQDIINPKIEEPEELDQKEAQPPPPPKLPKTPRREDVERIPPPIDRIPPAIDLTKDDELIFDVPPFKLTLAQALSDLREIKDSPTTVRNYLRQYTVRYKGDRTTKLQVKPDLLAIAQALQPNVTFKFRTFPEITNFILEKL